MCMTCMMVMMMNIKCVVEEKVKCRIMDMKSEMVVKVKCKMVERLDLVDKSCIEKVVV